MCIRDRINASPTRTVAAIGSRCSCAHAERPPTSGKIVLRESCKRGLSGRTGCSVAILSPLNDYLLVNDRCTGWSHKYIKNSGLSGRCHCREVRFFRTRPYFSGDARTSVPSAPYTEERGAAPSVWGGASAAVCAGRRFLLSLIHI